MMTLRFLVLSLFVSSCFVSADCVAAADRAAEEQPPLRPQAVVRPAVPNALPPFLEEDEGVQMSQPVATAEQPASPDLRVLARQRQAARRQARNRDEVF